EVPKPNSSSAQIIPWLSSPRIFPFLMVHASPSGVYRVVPIVATGTFWPTATLGAPHTICKGTLSPTETVVNFNLSALGCFTQVKTSPTTIPSSPPLTDWKPSIPSTSSPKSVNSSPVCSGVQSVFINCFSQLYEIFIYNALFYACKPTYFFHFYLYNQAVKLGWNRKENKIFFCKDNDFYRI